MLFRSAFVAEAVTKIYVGGDRVCRCGCAGDYVERGDPKFAKRLARFSRLWTRYNPTSDDVGENYLNITTGDSGRGRAITVYFD